MQIQKVCEYHNVECLGVEDYNLHPIESVKSSSGDFYTVYTPFYNKAKLLQVDKPNTESFNNYYNEKLYLKHRILLDNAYKKFVIEKQNFILKGGRSEGMALLNSTTAQQQQYKTSRNNASINTSLLSAHIKYGTLSIREVYYYFKRNGFDSLIGQLYWNEFYDLLMYNLPYKNTLGNSNFKEIKIKWYKNDKLFDAWKKGETGFPFIDAGMRQLNTEGWMHNRARMATANFLSMVLHIDWRKGEQYFATKLIDYDVAQNNGNWQWSVGVGVDKSGYLRIFNPITQSKSHDPNCEYIKKYVPELQNVQIDHIHKWDVHSKDYDTYLSPVVNYKEQRQKTLKMYAK
jgi:deoxyribodipyrimidine photo-lyase